METMKILAIDYGERYVGLAVTDDDGTIALRHSVIDQTQTRVFEGLATIVRQEAIGKVLVGVPISLRGNETQQTRVSRQFIKDLRQTLGDGVDVAAVDETLTSVEAAQRIRAEGGKAEEEHMEAARLMLEEYLRQHG